MLMNLTLITVGKQKAGPYSELATYYSKRLQRRFTMIEISSKAAKGKEISSEAEKIRPHWINTSYRIAFDQSGKSLSSEDFAGVLRTQSDQGKLITLLIGGAYGLEASLVQDADLVLNLGALTWPHQLVKVMVLEQLYRAQQILQGTPYHHG